MLQKMLQKYVYVCILRTVLYKNSSKGMLPEVKMLSNRICSFLILLDCVELLPNSQHVEPF